MITAGLACCCLGVVGIIGSALGSDDMEQDEIYKCSVVLLLGGAIFMLIGVI